MTPPAEPDPPPKKLTLKGAEFERVNEPSGAVTPPGADPMELLRLNREHEKKIGYCEPGPPPRRRLLSRRNREYLIYMVMVNLPLGYMLHNSGDPITNVFLIASILGFSGGLTWVMLVVWDNY